jgi:hypothetical protein
MTPTMNSNYFPKLLSPVGFLMVMQYVSCEVGTGFLSSAQKNFVLQNDNENMTMTFKTEYAVDVVC